VLKDFFWWLLKENLVINHIYVNILPKVFTIPNKPIGLTCPIQDKDSLLKKESKSACLFSIKGYTSGTTNKPMTVYRSFKSIVLEEYIIKSYLKKIGVPLSAKIAIFRGDKIVTSNSVYWKKMPFTNRLILSSYQLSELTAINYLKELEKYKPNIIMAYPSSITLLAKYALKLDWQPNWDLSGVFTSSETFTLDNQDIVRSVFGHVYDHYGQAERVAALQQCELGNYHVREDYSFVEFLPDEHGIRIVGTNLHNKAMTLKRYDTKDYVEGLNQKGDCKCGNTSPYVKRILGRDDDYVILSDGRQIGRLDVVFKEVINLIECQLEQTLLNEIIVRYVPDKGANITLLENSIERGLRERLNDDIIILFQEVNEVPRTKAGKFRSVIRNKDIVSV